VAKLSGKFRKKRKKHQRIIDTQKLSYFYTPYRKELLADNKDQMSFTACGDNWKELAELILGE